MIRPARGLVLVKPSETEETIPGGRIILTQNERASWAQYQMEVVRVGDHAICEKPEKCERPHFRSVDWSKDNGIDDAVCALHLHDDRLRPGAWVLVRPRSLVHAGTEEKLYFVRQEDVLAVFVT